MKTTINSKGELIIPPEICKQMNLKVGMYFKIDVDYDAKQIILTPVVTREQVKKLRGSLKGKGLLEALMKEKEFKKRY